MRRPRNEPSGETVTVTYDSRFLGNQHQVQTPDVIPELSSDSVFLDGAPVITYTHFSLALSRARRLARWVAWNIDGAGFDFADSISRPGVEFHPDPRLPADVQTLDDVYSANSLDRGHLARRSELLWGPLEEAKRANVDSFTFTNITPQRDTFNQSRAAGIWGELENALLDSAKAEAQRVNVFAGPVLAADDLPYRGTLVPRSFWKVIAYLSEAQVTARAFVLQQNLDGLEPVTLEDFDVYQVHLEMITQLTGIIFDPALTPGAKVEATADGTRKLSSAADVSW